MLLLFFGYGIRYGPVYPLVTRRPAPLRIDDDEDAILLIIMGESA